MRELGEDIDDCTSYDMEQAESDPEYKAKHIADKKTKQHGLSSEKYKSNKKNEEINELKARMEDKSKFYASVVSNRDEEIRKLSDEIEKLKLEMSQMNSKAPQTLSKASKQNDRYNETKTSLNAPETSQDTVTFKGRQI